MFSHGVGATCYKAEFSSTNVLQECSIEKCKLKLKPCTTGMHQTDLIRRDVFFVLIINCKLVFLSRLRRNQCQLPAQHLDFNKTKQRN